MKLMNRKTFILTSITAVMIVLSASSYAKIYRWVDQKGQTHYTATPPPPSQVKSDAENIESEIKASAGKYQAPQEGNEPVENKKPEPKNIKLAGPSPELIKYCGDQRKNLKTLQENYRNLWTDEKGNQTRLNQEQRKEKIESIQGKIQEDCSDIAPSTKS